MSSIARCDHPPLGAQDGAAGPILPDDARPARWIRQIDSVTVVGGP